jgi:iron(III) transport system ATP-binding protein
MVQITDVTVAFGSERAVRSASLTVGAGEVVSLLGPSGCGKTTLLRSIAGLQRITSGVIGIDGEIVADERRFVPPERRRVGMVFQDGGLFPHLTVQQNVAFGLRGHPRADDRVAEVLDLVDMAGFAGRLPGTLSGGQKQRVAVARSLAPGPAVLLLDEPFSALDAGLRLQVRRDVKRLIGELGITTVVVTHDQEEAFALGERVAVMANGTIQQVGTPAELYRHPVSPWVAQFVGEGVRVRGVQRGDVVATSLGELAVRVGGDAGSAAGYVGDVDVILRPEELVLRAGGPAEVTGVEYYGHDVRYDVRLADGELVSVRSTSPEFAPGDQVEVSFGGPSVPVWPRR